MSKDSTWHFAYDEERYSDEGDCTFLGVLTDGRRYLFFRTTEDNDEGDYTCHIHNSLLMDEDSEECSYPWSAENDAILLGCLNGLQNPNDYCGEGSPLRTLAFKSAAWCEKHICVSAVRAYLLEANDGVESVSYNSANDTLTVRMKEKDGPLRLRSFHLFDELGYYEAHYETDDGTLDFARMFRGNTGVHPDILGRTHAGDDPDILYAVLEACDRADCCATHIDIEYPLTV